MLISVRLKNNKLRNGHLLVAIVLRLEWLVVLDKGIDVGE